MSNIDYDRFTRVATRCAELASDPAQPPIVGLLYKETADLRISTFLTAGKAVDVAMTAFAKENHEALQALTVLDAPYAVARSAVLAVFPQTVLPDTLKTLPTDTDKLNAIERLLDVIDDHAGKPWADALLAGPFGQQAPKTIQEVQQAIEASKARSRAITDRAAAYGPAYEAYLAFKRVVRSACGPASREYRRIHLRASPGASPKDDEGMENGAATPPAETTTPPGGAATPPPGEPLPA